jgi:hypothetical protein
VSSTASSRFPRLREAAGWDGDVSFEDDQPEVLEKLRLLSEARVGLEVVEAKETGPSCWRIRQGAPLVPPSPATSGR